MDISAGSLLHNHQSNACHGHVPAEGPFTDQGAAFFFEIRGLWLHSNQTGGVLGPWIEMQVMQEPPGGMRNSPLNFQATCEINPVQNFLVRKIPGATPPPSGTEALCQPPPAHGQATPDGTLLNCTDNACRSFAA